MPQEKCPICILPENSEAIRCEAGAKLFVEMNSAYKRYRALSPMLNTKQHMTDYYEKFQAKRKAYYAHFGIEV